MRDIDNFYLEKEEPVKSCLLALRDSILNYNQSFEPVWKYRLPCFLYRNHIFCYLWVDKKTQHPYIAIGKGRDIDHPELIRGNRTFVKLLFIDPKKDLPIKTIHTIFDLAMGLYD
ncbi:DUF1801 domain-containing protein [Fulvivirga sp. M361]|uniref:DUF1801 domain-containing protein n=1 Tax=Fulvivirga sp. M361 TaxID=2594266 RepID=UPI002105C370|nr:DUF1801 domain-containing protein [Fulvivirga sp. M361]